jgi:Sugar-binding N-terminal domain
MKASNSNQNTDMPLLLGSVADDFTGASDLADTLVASGLSTILLIGLPEGGRLPAEAADAEAVVFALKTRSIQASEAGSRFLPRAFCDRQVAGISISSTARRLIPPTQATLVRSPMHCSTR